MSRARTLPDIWLVIPTRGRPANLGRLLAQPETMLEGNVSVMVVLDHDDPQLEAYREELESAARGWIGPRLWWRWHVEPHPGPGRSSYRRNVNLGAAEAFGKGATHVIILGDDSLPLFPSWANQLAMAAGEWQLSYPNDGHQGHKLPTVVCMPRGVWQALGKEAIPVAVDHLYGDAYWLAVGQGWHARKAEWTIPEGIGITYLPDVLVEHIHPHAGKTETDAGYEAIYSSELPERDGAMWRQYRRAGHLERDIKRVRRDRELAERARDGNGAEW